MKGNRDKIQDRRLKTRWLCEKMTSWKSSLHQVCPELDRPLLPSPASPGVLSPPNPSPASEPDNRRLPRAGLLITLKFSDKDFADGDYSFFLSSFLSQFSSTFCFWVHRVDSVGRVYKAKIMWAVSQACIFNRIKWLRGRDERLI